MKLSVVLSCHNEEANVVDLDARLVPALPFASTGFLAGRELLVNAIDAGYRAAEFPTVLHSRVHGVSKAKIARTIRAHLGFQWSLLTRRITGAKPAGRPAAISPA